MSKILINELKQEISSFNPYLGQIKDWVTLSGPAVLSFHQGLGTEVAGALAVFAQHPELEITGGYSARAITSGGTLSDPTFAQLAEEFLAAVRANPDVDAIYFCLHGACAALAIHDCEGYLLAETREKQGRKASSEALYAKARALAPKPPACPSPYCTIRAYDTKARESFSKLAALGDSVELRQTRAEILTNQNKHAEAAAEWRAALKIAAGRPDLEQGLATSLYAAQQFDEAEALLKNLVKGEPGNPELHFLLGDCLLQKGDAEAAVPALRRAYTLNPKFPPARSTLGRALLATGKAADAIPHLEASLPFDDDGTTHFQLSRAYAATGQTAKAEAAAKRSQELRQ